MPLLIDLLEACPQLKIVVTSREALRLREEYLFPLSPLALPDLEGEEKAAHMLQSPAISLFVQHVKAHTPAFELNDANVRAIAEICIHLDGIPLALELAAARIDLFSPPVLLSRLKMHRLQNLGEGPRNAPPRQRTLRDTILWSYHLLNPAEKTLFKYSAVFSGGASLAALGSILPCLPDKSETIIDQVSSLLRKHLLLKMENGAHEPVFTMFETIRECALECAQGDGEEQHIRQAHATYFLSLVQQAEPKIISEEQLPWLALLEQEQHNLRVALLWFLQSGAIEDALLFCSVAWHFWLYRGHLSEGYQLIENVLAQSNRAGVGVAALTKAQVHYAAGIIGYFLYGYTSTYQPEIASHIEEALRIYRAAGDSYGIGITLNAYGYMHMLVGDYEKMRACYQESLPLLQDTGDNWHLAEVWGLVASDAMASGEYTQARSLFEKCVAFARASGDRRSIGFALEFLGKMLFATGEYAAALPLAKESLSIAIELGGKPLIASSLEDVGKIAAMLGHQTWAVLLGGTAEVLREVSGQPIPQAENKRYYHSLSTIREQLGDEQFQTLWAQGRSMTPQQALEILGP